MSGHRSFGSGRLTGALLDRLTHHVHILEINGESFRFATSKRAQRRQGHALNTPTKKVSEGATTMENRSRARTIMNQGFSALFSYPDYYTFTPLFGTICLRR
jgi:hypothetical protein